MEGGGAARDSTEHLVLAIGPDGAEHDCRLSWVAEAPHRYRLIAAVADEPPVGVEAGDLFEALRQLRRQFEARGIALCCAGARRDVWSSGMQRDMGMGRAAYILTFPRTAERPQQVNIFEPAEPDAIASVAEQEAFARAWMKSPLAH
jgi:hypothetical protein